MEDFPLTKLCSFVCRGGSLSVFLIWTSLWKDKYGTLIWKDNHVMSRSGSGLQKEGTFVKCVKMSKWPTLNILILNNISE